MADLLRFGEAIFVVLLLLIATIYVVVRLHIHSLKKWMRDAQREIQALRSELEAPNRG